MKNVKIFSYVGLFLVGFILLACKKDDAVIEEFDDRPYELKYQNNTLPIPNLPEDNPLTIEKVKLGNRLFYEKILSRDNTINCASCHIQKDGFSDLRQFSLGVNDAVGKRQAMPIFNLAWHENGFFWDGRAELLRHQSILPIQDPLEMDSQMEDVITKLNLNESYKNHFIRAFGDASITEERISLALEAFMFSIVSDDSKFDRFLKGKATLTASEERGRHLFFTEYNPFFPESSGADCAHCHSGNNFENDLYMNNGLDEEFADRGREDATGNPEDRGKFKVPSLRNIAVTGPYMHDGRFTSLEEVIAHYNDGIKHSITLDPALEMTMDTGLMLDDADIQDLVNFLNTLTDERYLNNVEYQQLNY